MTAVRQHLPNRRDGRHVTVHLGGQEFNIHIGFDPATNEPREVFINAFRDGFGAFDVLARWIKPQESLATIE